MQKKIVYALALILISSCNNLSADFFEFLFNSKEIKLNIICSDSPSLFSEGQTFEVYSMSYTDIELVKTSMFSNTRLINSHKYTGYKVPKWQRTPVLNMKDSIFSFINHQMGDKINTCFTEKKLIEVIQKENNFYVFLYDTLGRRKLFVWDTKEDKLFLLTSYQL